MKTGGRKKNTGGVRGDPVSKQQKEESDLGPRGKEG